MTIPVPPPSGEEGLTNGYRGDCTPSLRLLCSITGVSLILVPQTGRVAESEVTEVTVVTATGS